MRLVSWLEREQNVPQLRVLSKRSHYSAESRYPYDRPTEDGGGPARPCRAFLYFIAIVETEEVDRMILRGLFLIVVITVAVAAIIIVLANRKFDRWQRENAALRQELARETALCKCREGIAPAMPSIHPRPEADDE